VEIGILESWQEEIIVKRNEKEGREDVGGEA
jgi:hypothetical protein